MMAQDIKPNKMTDTPTCEDLIEENGYQEVNRHVDDRWRHGSYITQVFKRLDDGTYWRAKYELSSDGETHGLRDNDADIIQVWRRNIIAFEYVTMSP